MAELAEIDDEHFVFQDLSETGKRYHPQDSGPQDF
jgi:hypothetical protein